MPKIKIAADELLDRLEDRSGFQTGYLDKQTGQILIWSEDPDDTYEHETRERIEADADRYIEIEPVEPSEGFQIMERFVADLPDGEDRRLLEKALSWKKPFSNFKRALDDMGDVRLKWFDFHEKELRQMAIEWLEAEELDAELISPREALP